METNKDYDQSGPWYERDGPTAADVRKDIFEKLKIKENEAEKESEEEGKDMIRNRTIEAILLRHIPDTMNDFGSWRGYQTFGLDSTIMTQIKTEIDSI